VANLAVKILLLGVIVAVVVLAINPVEEANRKSDKTYKSQAEYLVKGIASFQKKNGQFPWGDEKIGFISAGDPQLGVCERGCGTRGKLISYLDSKFGFDEFVKNHQTTDATKKIFVSVDNACFIPQARKTRIGAINEKKVYELDLVKGVKSKTAVCNSPDDAWMTNKCYICF